jgi:hypothetical protein
MRALIALSIIWCCFLVHALFLCTVIPLWEGYDEYSHFAVIQWFALHRGLPDATMNSSLEVAESRTLVPAGDWTAADRSQGLMSYEDYWRLPPPDREQLRTRLKNIPAAWWTRDAHPRLALYEAQQPPLYYWITAPIYRMFETSTLPTRVWILRCLTALMASLVIPAGYFAARQICGGTMIPLGIALIIASMPELYISVCRVSNEGLAIGLGGVAVVALLRLHHQPPSMTRGVWTGIILGATLLSKAYFLVLLPLTLVALARAWYRDPALRKKALVELLIVLMICFAISGWWYGRNLALTHSLTGEQTDVAANATKMFSLPQAVVKTPWLHVFDFMLVSYIWVGDGSFLVARSWMYRVVEFLWVLALAGMLVQFVRWRGTRDTQLDLLLMLMAPMLLLLALCFHALQAMQSTGVPGTLGHYLYALVVPEAILLAVGLDWRGLQVPVLVSVFAGLDVFTTWFLLLPYYTGLIQHDAHGGLRALHAGQFAHGGLSVMFERLLVNGPEFLSAAGVSAMAAAALLATVILIGMSCWIAKTGEQFK